MCDFSRGDIVFVENPMQTPHGHVVAGNHPAVVIQNDAGNEHSNNLIVAYITSQLKRLELPTHVVLQWYGGLKKVSVVPSLIILRMLIWQELIELLLHHLDWR